jgi:flagellar protein FliT
MSTHDYESLSALSEQMRQAADRGEWDKVIALELQFKNQIARMKPVEILPDEPSRKRMMALISKILANDADIRNHTDIWMNQLKGIIQSNLQEQKLNRLYHGAK